MSGIAVIITSALLVGLGALALLLWALSNGQYDDMEGDSQRILLDDPEDTVNRARAGSAIEQPQSADPARR